MSAQLTRRGLLAAGLGAIACTHLDTATPTRPVAGQAAASPTSAGRRPIRPESVGPLDGEARSLAGAGATFPAPLYARWFEEYRRLTGVEVSYQSIGSGGGIKSIGDGTVDFGASDAPLNDGQLTEMRAELLHIPTTLGAVAATYNLPGVLDAVRFRPETLADVFLGRIVRWNDPALVADNPALAGVERDIISVHRGDGSGTTFIWTDYLSRVSRAWRERVGNGTSVRWPVGLAGEGNPGVADQVRQNPFSVGYVELAYALQNKLGVGWVRNRSGRFVEPTLTAVTAAAMQPIAADLRASIVDAPDPAAYPIAGFSYQLVYRDGPDWPRAVALARLLWWEIHDGQRLAGDLAYAPLPPDVVRRAEERIATMRAGGAQVLAL